ncbi:Short-chain collagen C4 [Exaiptasia diaphana]|nr:Short-chain collagen C4 [Exaiptasia diaphana]
MVNEDYQGSKVSLSDIHVLEGRDGRDGQHGAPGPRGSPGSQGPRGAQGLRGLPGPKSGGVQYIRWGKNSCPSGAKLVYKGYVGGEHYNHPGGGSNYVCLTESPKYASYNDAHQKWSAYMYGAEYQTKQSYNPFLTDPYNHDAPCAVCFVPNRNVKLMIPATYECPAGWSREYWGYLMAEHCYHKNQKGFICVDRDPEVVKGSGRDHDQALLYAVEGRCGSLPCLPYVEGRELTCAVCTNVQHPHNWYLAEGRNSIPGENSRSKEEKPAYKLKSHIVPDRESNQDHSGNI